MSRYLRWETFELYNGSTLAFDGNLTLGGPDTGTGVLYIDQTSRVRADSGSFAVLPAAGDNLSGGVWNNGAIDMLGGGPNNSFRVRGRYYSDVGVIRLDTQLSGDGAPSDRLVIDGGDASGRTGLWIRQYGETVGPTENDGIEVVEAQNGAVTGALTLAEPVAGPFEYYLYRGGEADDTADNWYLPDRPSAASASAASTPTLSARRRGQTRLLHRSRRRRRHHHRPLPPPAPPSPPSPPSPPAPPAYRPEVSLFMALPVEASIYGREILGTYHERMGGLPWPESTVVGNRPQGIWAHHRRRRQL